MTGAPFVSDHADSEADFLGRRGPHKEQNDAERNHDVPANY